MKKIKPITEPHSKGCLNCGYMPVKLPMNYKIIQGFGGAYITKNGKLYYMPDDWDGTKEGWKKAKTLMYIELRARKEPKANWRLVNLMALHDEVYQRQGKNNWVLIKKGMGFA